MSTVKASVYVPPTPETENLNIENLTDTEILEKIIYMLMVITILIFIRKLILAVFPNSCRLFGAKRE